MAVRNYRAFTQPMLELAHHTVAFIYWMSEENTHMGPKIDPGTMNMMDASTNAILVM